MIYKSLTVGLIYLVISYFLMSCGSQSIRADLESDAYFEYAKDLFDRGKYYNAITEFTVITLKFSADPIVDDAQFYLAESHMMYKEYLIAAAEYQKVIEDYPESPYVEQSYYKIGLCFTKLSLRAELDQEYTNQALRHFQNYLEYYPNSKFRPDAERDINDLRKKLSAKLLKGGNQYRAMGMHDSAIIYYNIILEKYYDTISAELALFWKAECYYKLKEFEDAIATYTIFVEKYTNSEKLDSAKSKISELQSKMNKEAEKSQS
jgi:outer membrane protein assembly factor BamD